MTNSKPYSELNSDQKLRAKCRSTTKMLIRRKKLKKGVCEVCGSADVQAHHDDYTKPDQVRWFCKKHHEEHHKALQTPKKTTCSCGCGEPIEPERLASGQHYRKDCHNAYMRRFRAKKKLEIENLKAELNALKNAQQNDSK